MRYGHSRRVHPWVGAPPGFSTRSGARFPTFFGDMPFERNGMCLSAVRTTLTYELSFLRRLTGRR